MSSWPAYKETEEHITREIYEDAEPHQGPTAREDHERIREESPKTYYEDVVMIPGYRDAPDRCRPHKPVGVCKAGHPILGRSSCQTYGCPDHWRDRIEETTINVVARLAAWREARDVKRVSHIVVSPDAEKRYSERAMWDERSEAYDALEAAGALGGASVVHPFRTNDRGNHLYKTARDLGELEEGTGRWRFLREISDDWGELQNYIEASPHYHTFTAASDVEPDESRPEVVKRIRSFKRFYYQDTEAYRDMAASVYYVLTHAAHQPGRKALSWYGELHSFDPEEELTLTKWDRIQREAEKAVRGWQEEVTPESEESCLHGPDECPREGCEAPVLALGHLRDLLEDDDWVSELLIQRDGRERWLRCLGLLAWCEGRTDRPPPGAVESKPRLLEWLEDLGKQHQAAPQQVGISSYV